MAWNFRGLAKVNVKKIGGINMNTLNTNIHAWYIADEEGNLGLVDFLLVS